MRCKVTEMSRSSVQVIFIDVFLPAAGGRQQRFQQRDQCDPIVAAADFALRDGLQPGAFGLTNAVVIVCGVPAFVVVECMAIDIRTKTGS